MIRILLADDLALVLHLLTGLCESDAGFEVVGAVETRLDSYGFAARAMGAGAQAFLTKQAVVRELVNAIRKVYASGNYLDSEMAQRMALAHIRDVGSPADKLSDREIDVLLLMLRGHTSAEISEKLALAAKTVEHHRRSLRQKLNVMTDAQLGVVAGRYGLDPFADGI